MNCYEYKGGNGNRVPDGSATERRIFTVGAFVQANFGSRARIEPVAGRHVRPPNCSTTKTRWRATGSRSTLGLKPPSGAGSVIRPSRRPTAPLLPGQCKAPCAARSAGSWPEPAPGAAIFSGDIFLAFSHPRMCLAWRVRFPRRADRRRRVRHAHVPCRGAGWNDLYTAVVQAVEEAVLNAPGRQRRHDRPRRTTASPAPFPARSV